MEITHGNNGPAGGILIDVSRSGLFDKIKYNLVLAKLCAHKFSKQALA